MNKITIDLDLMNSVQLTPNGFTMLWYLYHNKKCKIGPTLTGILIKQGFITSSYELTSKAKVLFAVDVKQLDNDKMKEWLLELREIFPKGIKISGSPVKSAIGIPTIKKMKKFIKEYGYSKEIIEQATKAYVNQKKRDNYDFMMKFTNFINKQGVGSELASFCELVTNGDELNGRQEERITKTL